ncbi:MAG: FAD-dependent oxidoreductase, partial [Planctomycetes bacterium]|nr:FAD-dependent oxidoreductase [Planctomycetota bacterium]
MIKRWCESKGVTVMTGTRITGIEAADGGFKLALDGGASIDADLVVCATGVAPYLDFLEGSGVATDHGILVDQHLETNVAGIFAAGDVAQGYDFSTGKQEVHAIQPTASAHGRIAALNMAGQATEYEGSLAMNVLNTLGLVSSSYGLWMGVDGGDRAVAANEDAFKYLRLEFDGDVIVVGAPSEACGWDCQLGGAAYVFRFDGAEWIKEATLVSQLPQSTDYLGYSVAVHGDIVVVGKPQTQNPSGQHYGGVGAVHVYRYDGTSWNEEAVLSLGDEVETAAFGAAVAVWGDHILIGAPLDPAGCADGISGNCGALYLYSFDGSTWTESDVFGSTLGGGSSRFGSRVAMSEHAVFAAGSWGSATFLRIESDTLVPVGELLAQTGDIVASVSSLAFDSHRAVVGRVGYVDGVYDAGAVSVAGISAAASDPPCLAVDARQPSEPYDDASQEWSEITVFFDEDPGSVLPEDFAVTIHVPGEQITVDDVTVEGNAVTVHLSAPIPVSEWTTITHIPTGVATRIGSLPGDVNGDRLTGPNDVLHLIDILNGLGETDVPPYRTDIDRSGATNSADVLRLIDLLNGAGVYDMYLGATLGE